jgi:PAS domain S-box-containing protein
MKADIRASPRAENAKLRARLAEAEETLRAIRNGEVDAFVVGERLYMLTSADAASNQMRGADLEQVSDVREITEWKEAESTLLEKDKSLTQIADLTPTILIRCSRDLRYLFVNRAAARFLGYAPEEIVGKTVREILGNDAFTTILPYIERVLQGERVEFETEITGSTAGRRFMHFAYAPERDSQNNVVGWLGTVTDITKRKRAEKALRASRSRLAADLEAITRLYEVGNRCVRAGNGFHQCLEMILDAAVFITGAEKGIIQLFDAGSGALVIAAQRGFEEPFLNFFARVRDESSAYGAAMLSAQGVAVEDVTRSELFVAQASLDALLAAGVRAMQSTPLVSGDGSLLGMISTHFSRPTRLDERESRLMGLLARQAADYLERKHAEEKLRESEERLRLAHSAANIGAFDWDIAGGLSVWAPETERMWGLSGGGFGGTYEDWKKQVHPEDLLGANDMVRRALADPDTPYSFEYRIIRPDGSVRWIYAKGSTIRDESGRPVRMIGINMDVTDRKQAEAERERLLAEEQRMREAAEAATRAKDEFLAVVSHELRSPLNAILGYARIARVKSHNAAAVTRNCEIIERHARMQQKLIEDLLDTARVISGKLKLELAPADLRLVLEEAVEVVRPAAEAKRIELATRFGKASKPLLCDAARLRQVVWNLLQNAIKFTPEGGRVELRMKRAGQRVNLIVSDTGRGIEPNFLPAVFDRFRQGDMSRTRRHGGLGLGLALAKQLVEMHGGTIEAASAGVGKGATFTVTLPLGAQQVASYPQPSRPIAEISAGPEAMPLKDLPRLDGMRVLVVDDQEEARLMIAQSLGEWGASVTAVASGREALALIQRSAFDALVCDIAMPEMDGFEVIGRLRSMESSTEPSRLSRLPAIALTALARPEERLQSLAAGFQTHIAKPVELAELIMVIATLIRNH